jgi:hypothetical protein
VFTPFTEKENSAVPIMKGAVKIEPESCLRYPEFSRFNSKTPGRNVGVDKISLNYKFRLITLFAS